MKKFRIIIIGVIVFVILSAVGVFAVDKYNTSRTTAISKPTQTSTVSNSPAAKKTDATTSATVTK